MGEGFCVVREHFLLREAYVGIFAILLLCCLYWSFFQRRKVSSSEGSTNTWRHSSAMPFFSQDDLEITPAGGVASRRYGALKYIAACFTIVCVVLLVYGVFCDLTAPASHSAENTTDMPRSMPQVGSIPEPSLTEKCQAYFEKIMGMAKAKNPPSPDVIPQGNEAAISETNLAEVCKPYTEKLMAKYQNAQLLDEAAQRDLANGKQGIAVD